jgi:Outer membrane protein beta-barrel domain
MRVKSLLLLTFCVFLGVAASAQEGEKPKVFRPDIPGNFLIDFGVTGTTLSPKNFSIGWFGSRSINLYYYYPIRFGKSKFSFNPGIGLGLDKFKFKSSYYVADTLKDGAFELVPNFRTDSTVYKGLKKSILGQHYIDIPLEFKFSANPDDPNRTFWVSVGARAGYLYNPFTKIKQKVDGETLVYKNKFYHGQDKFRYGPSLRVGLGNFNLFGFYNMSPLFAKDKGPDKTTMTTFSMGFSIIGL